MKWDIRAEEAVAGVPFFVRGRVRKRAEEEAANSGSPVVRLQHVQACRKKFLENMESEVKGYSLETCFGAGGCPNRAVDSVALVERIEGLLGKKDLKTFLKQRVRGPLKIHHEFRIAVADCPNACSRPQIVDLGLIGAQMVEVRGEEDCTRCGACVEACREGALALPAGAMSPVHAPEQCLHCGQCLPVCPSETLRGAKRGFRVLVGGKLGRHPQLGMDLGAVYSIEETLLLVERSLDCYLRHNREGERFGEILKRIGCGELTLK
jgi:dissimilatory sulfite reductase (desulfoviridin) alpha/beta subunit